MRSCPDRHIVALPEVGNDLGDVLSMRSRQSDIAVQAAHLVGCDVKRCHEQTLAGELLAGTHEEIEVQGGGDLTRGSPHESVSRFSVNGFGDFGGAAGIRM
jgi:hypothetical protein